MRKKVMIILAIIILYSSSAFADTFISTHSNAEKEVKRKKIATASDISYESLSNNDVIYQVSFPANIHAYLDPGDLSGKGQVFSNQYEVKNCGNTDIGIKIKNIRICSESEEDYEFYEDDIVSTSSNAKEVHINMVWKNKHENKEKVLTVIDGYPDEYVLYLKAAQYNKNGEFVDFHEESIGLFYFTGTLSPGFNVDWEDSRITATFDYEIVYGEESKEE